MNYEKKFKTTLLVRLMFILLTMWLMLHLIMDSMVFNGGILAVLLLLQVYSLTKQLESQQNAFRQALESINNNELNIQYRKAHIGSELHNMLNRAISKLARSRQDLQKHTQFMQMVTNHIHVAIIVADQRDRLILSNRSAHQFFDIASFPTLDTIKHKQPSIYHCLKRLRSGDSELINIDLTEVKVSAVEIKMSEGIQMLYTFESLGVELGEKEINSWNKIIRVLSHEIMNSLTPITSLAQTASDMLQSLDVNKPKSIQQETLDDAANAMETIARRGENLTQFINGYRNISSYINLQLKQVSILKLITKTLKLYQQELNSLNIDTRVTVTPENLSATLDESAMEQVLLNLLANAIDACENIQHGEIKFFSEYRKGRVFITVEDNGCEIEEESAQDIFVPFFTTKTKGVGIGLGLCRQIVHAHNGYIYIYENNKPGTRIQMRF